MAPSKPSAHFYTLAWMRGIRRLLLLAVAAIVAFAVALFTLDEDPQQGAAPKTEPDRVYSVGLRWGESSHLA